MNNLSRNKPLALVVGAASFIGSSLIEELLNKGIQVIGIDEGGSRDNLTDASRDKNFQLLSQSAETLRTRDLPRLDYAVFAPIDIDSTFKFQQVFKSFLDLSIAHKAKIILCSSINLYEKDAGGNSNLKFAEKTLADQAIPEKINARVVRLSAVYGPRMDFSDHDPMIKLIKAAVLGKLNVESTPLEFTTRALYIKDAVRLLIKAIMHGSTAQKIYDGAASPVKISEIKQVLLDPLWYEEKGFKPTQLPPWSTPNLNKTSKELSWSASMDIVLALKETLAYFNSHKDKIPAEAVEEKKIIHEPEDHEVEKRELNSKPETKKSDIVWYFPKINMKNIKDKTVVMIGIAIIFFALVFPVLKFGFTLWSVKSHLENSMNEVVAGDFDGAEKESKEAEKNAEYLNGFIGKLVFVRQLNFLQNYYDALEQSLKITEKATNANYHAIAGARLLTTAMSVISGEKEGDLAKILGDAQTEFKTADSEIGEVSASLNDSNFTAKLPIGFQNTFKDLQNKSENYRHTVSLGRALADLLPEIVAIDGEKSYLVTLQDNRVLRPGGGQLKSFVEVTFNHGKLAKITGDSIENLDRQFAGKIEPPADLKTDLGETNWRMRDASYDLDFPASAHNITWFYNKESGKQVSGVIAMDFPAIARLLQATGPLKTGGSKDEITGDNAAIKIPLGREGNAMAAETLKSLVERIFYLSKQNWAVLAKNSGQSLDDKNLLIYLSDPTAFSYLTANDWTGKVAGNELGDSGERNDLLAFSETNMSQGQDSTAIERSMSLVSKIDNSGIVSHKLTFTFSSGEKLTGKYSNRLKIYLPQGTKLSKTTWKDKLIKDVSSFSDYGLQGYSMLLEQGKGEQNRLSLEYQDISPVKYNDKQLVYRQTIIKQPGQGGLPVDYKLTYPLEIKAGGNLVNTAGESSIKTDLTKDLVFEVILKQQ